MLTVTAKFIVKEENINKFLKLSEPLIAETRKEAGCIRYELFQDIQNSQIITFIEEWKDAEALKAHENSSHFKSIVPKLSELQLEEIQVNMYKKL